MQADGSVVVTSRMGRIDSEVGRKMAARDAAEAEKKRIAEEKAAAEAAEKAPRRPRSWPRRRPRKQAASAAAQQPMPAPPPPRPADAAAAEAAQTDETATGSTGLLGSVASASATSSAAEAEAAWRAAARSMTSRGLNCPLPGAEGAQAARAHAQPAAGSGWRPPIRWPRSTFLPSATRPATGWSRRRRRRRAPVPGRAGKRRD